MTDSLPHPLCFRSGLLVLHAKLTAPYCCLRNQAAKYCHMDFDCLTAQNCAICDEFLEFLLAPAADFLSYLISSISSFFLRAPRLQFSRPLLSSESVPPFLTPLVCSLYPPPALNSLHLSQWAPSLTPRLELSCSPPSLVSDNVLFGLYTNNMQSEKDTLTRLPTRSLMPFSMLAWPRILCPRYAAAQFICTTVLTCLGRL